MFNIISDLLGSPHVTSLFFPSQIYIYKSENYTYNIKREC